MTGQYRHDAHRAVPAETLFLRVDMGLSNLNVNSEKWNKPGLGPVKRVPDQVSSLGQTPLLGLGQEIPIKTLKGGFENRAKLYGLLVKTVFS